MYPDKSRTKERLRNGEVAFGSLTLIPEPSLVELVGLAGYDFMVIDTEHTSADGDKVTSMIRAGQAARITPFVRVRHVEEKQILWVLDSGAEGIMIPLLESAATAREAYRLTRYPPEGDRTLCSATRTAAHGVYRNEFLPFLERTNSEMMVLGLIETPEAADSIGEIAAEENGVDVFFAGRADLSIKMGVGYDPAHPRVIDITKRILSTAIERGKIAGVLAYDLEDAQAWMDFGCRFIIYSQPEILLSTHYREMLGKMKRHASILVPGNRAA